MVLDLATAGMQDWVDTGGGCNSQDSLPPKDGHLNKQAVSWPEGEHSTASRESDVLTTRPPIHIIHIMLNLEDF